MKRNIFKIANLYYITSDEDIKRGDKVICVDPSDLYYINSDKEITTFSSGMTLAKIIDLKNDHVKARDLNSGYELGIHYHQFGELGDWKKIVLTSDADLVADDVQFIGYKCLEYIVKNPNCEFIDLSTYHVKGDISGTLHYKTILRDCIEKLEGIVQLKESDINGKQWFNSFQEIDTFLFNELEKNGMEFPIINKDKPELNTIEAIKLLLLKNKQDGENN